jgi:hypothetical protein
MANLLFHYSPILSITYTSTSADASYPLTNLNSVYVADIWKSANNTNGQQLAADYALTGKTFVIVDGSNIQAIIDAAGTVKLQSAADSAFTTSVTTWKNWTTGGDAFNIYTLISAASNRQYWRILYEDTASTIPYVGNFWIGTTADLGFWHAYPYRGGQKSFNVVEGVARDGRIRTSEIYSGGRRLWSLPLKNISSTVASTFSTFFNLMRGKANPFYFSDVNGNTYLVMFDMDEDPTQAITAGDISESNIELKSIEVS